MHYAGGGFHRSVVPPLSIQDVACRGLSVKQWNHGVGSEVGLLPVIGQYLSGNPWLMEFIKFVQLWSFWPAAWMWSGIMGSLLSTVFIIAWMVANSAAASMLSERSLSLEDRCVDHWLIRDSTVATELLEIALAPLCHLSWQCWILKKYLRFLFKSKEAWVVYFAKVSVPKYSC